MSGVEIGIAVVGAIAALITAYKDAGGIVGNIKARRKAKGALPPSFALEESLKEGQEEIERITAKGIQRFGTDFEQGDDIAYGALQALTIEVQATFLHHLVIAGKNDDFTDFESCIDSAIEARLKAVTILNELYLRQQKRSSLVNEPNLQIPGRMAGKEDDKNGGVMKEIKGSKKRSDTVGTFGTESKMPPTPAASRKSSWNLFKKRQRTSSTESWREDPSTVLNSAESSAAGASPVLSASPASITLRTSRTSTILTPPISPASTFTPYEALAGAGFCKGAYHVQQGVYETSVQVSMRNMEWSCHCRKCSFATPADKDERGRPRFDDNVYTASMVRFRPLLLFKSHLASKEKKARSYKCLICILGGDSSAIFQGEDRLLEHISHHQNAFVGGVELAGPIRLEPTGVREGSERTFDICFPNMSTLSLPASAIELDDTGIVEADDGMNYGGEDEVFKNQWVNEGLR
ncbi:uncharacterized protein PV06_02548 [Exophiala oligosperma]|uniref:Uncharacterized protein n=1 Tax=Exophiala oligosperma TaxID=215243 RepID=A0A0D2DV06_9EURO|nr:uncharacterized protein PV06_02548 [Exophiala oligosperma]KIW46928.1 hypothetical protein PV06_02548 [Exophiala oligosperma]